MDLFVRSYIAHSSRSAHAALTSLLHSFVYFQLIPDELYLQTNYIFKLYLPNTNLLASLLCLDSYHILCLSILVLFLFYERQ